MVKNSVQPPFWAVLLWGKGVRRLVYCLLLGGRKTRTLLKSDGWDLRADSRRLEAGRLRTSLAVWVPQAYQREPVGEVWVSGPTVARGYLGNPTETEHAFTDGWFHTGDLGSLDADGDLFLTGRIKDLINRGGEKISPEHVEDVLSGCPGVAEAAVFPIPDATYGERVGAAVVLREDAEEAADEGADEGADEDRILAYCRTRLAPYEVPDRVEITPALPHTAKGALDRRAVVARYGNGDGAG